MVSEHIAEKWLEKIGEYVGYLFNDRKRHDITIHVTSEELQTISNALKKSIAKSNIITCGLPKEDYTFKKISLPFGGGIMINLEEYVEET